MLPQFLRLDLRSQVGFFDQAKRKNFTNLLFFYRQVDIKSTQVESTQVESTQLAIIVKKKFGYAPDRAKYKRQVREAIIQLQQQNPDLFVKPLQIVILIKSKAASLDEYKKQIYSFLKEVDKK